MSLLDIVKEVVRDMEEDERPGSEVLDRYVYALKKALSVSDSHKSELIPPEVQNALEIEKARKAIREEREKSGFEETREGRMVEVLGGPHGGSGDFAIYHTIDPSMPESAHTLIGDLVYTLSNGQLHHNEEETMKRLKK